DSDVELISMLWSLIGGGISPPYEQQEKKKTFAIRINKKHFMLPPLLFYITWSHNFARSGRNGLT
ncbi:TPA: hypothetical protein ACNTH0_004841, partial [Escherichia coli]